MSLHRVCRSAAAMAVVWAVLGGVVVVSGLLIPHADAAIVQDSEQVPPGDPVVGSELPGDLDVGTDRTDYALLALLATCLIGAGILLVSVERWERRRSASAFADSRD